MRISSKSPRTALPRKRQESQGLEGAVAHWVESAWTPATCGLQSPSLIPQPVKLLQNQKINGKSFKNSSVKSRRFMSGLPSGSQAGAVVASRDTWSRFSRSRGQQRTRLLPAQCPLQAFLRGVIDVLLQVQCPPPPRMRVLGVRHSALPRGELRRRRIGSARTSSRANALLP